MTDFEKYWPVAIIVAIFVFVAYAFYDSYVRDEARKCEHAAQVIVDYATCEVKEGCVIHLTDVQKHSAQSKINKRCEANNNDDDD